MICAIRVPIRLLSYLLSSVAIAATLPSLANAQSAFVRVVDLGPGLCVIATTPDGHSMVYDTGHHTDHCRDAVRELVPSHVIDLLVLSHSDADHISGTRDILAENAVTTIIHPGDPRGPTLGPIRAAIAAEPAADIWNLTVRPIPFGHVFQIGSATATFVAGWSDGNQTRISPDTALNKSMRNNALSAIIRLQFAGHSVLLTGDTVGRHDKKDNSLCGYAERLVVANAAVVPIDSDVLVGQHHGANNGTANCFIEAVSPTFVVFSAGHEYKHPRQATADRLVANGVDPDNIFRTDRGDHEPVPPKLKDRWKREWVYKSIAGCRDEPGDDDVVIELPADPAATPKVNYRIQSNGC